MGPPWGGHTISCGEREINAQKLFRIRFLKVTLGGENGGKTGPSRASDGASCRRRGSVDNLNLLARDPPSRTDPPAVHGKPSLRQSTAHRNNPVPVNPRRLAFQYPLCSPSRLVYHDETAFPLRSPQASVAARNSQLRYAVRTNTAVRTVRERGFRRAKHSPNITPPEP